jgi:tryptophan synthase alpha chain
MKLSLKESLNRKSRKLLSLYYTMGYPTIDSIDEIFQAITESGEVDFIELGMPYSDPLADGPTIQKTSSIAIKNGMTISKYFELAKFIHTKYAIPLVFMGYLNQIYQLGKEQFCKLCKKSGIEGVIIPDLPIEIYEKEFQELFEKYDILVSFLITPTTSNERIRQIGGLATGFIYIVSSSSITGNKGDISDSQKKYYERIKACNLQKPTLIGFGIHNKQTYDEACKYADGAIIGSEFLRVMEDDSLRPAIKHFIKSLKA